MKPEEFPYEASMIPPEAEENIQRIKAAASGEYGEDQQLIALQFLGVTDLVLRKNRDYGSSVFKSPAFAPELDAGSSILVRMSDKFERIRHLRAEAIKGNRPLVNESIEDTINDLTVYGQLYIICVRKEAEAQQIVSDMPAD